MNNMKAIIVKFLKHILISIYVGKFPEGIYFASGLFDSGCKKRG